MWLVFWAILSAVIGKELLLPSPLNVLKRLADLAVQSSFWLSIAKSLLRIMAGYFAALITGSIAGFAAALNRILDEILTPAARVIRATPVVSFIMLLFVFAAKDHIPAVTMVMPAVWLNVYEGVCSTDRKLLEMAQLFKLSRGSVIRNIYMPCVMPFFRAAAKGGIGLAWKAGIAAEVLVNPRIGIGSMLYSSKVYLETTDLFAWTLVVIIIRMLLEKLIVRYVFDRDRK